MSDVWSREWDDDPVAEGLRHPTTRRRTVHIHQVHPLSNPAKVRSFLHQEKYWVNAQLERIKVKDMDADHLASTMAFLLERANKVFFHEDLRAEVREMPVDWLEDPRIRMMATPLFRKMKERYLKIMRDGRTVEVTQLDVKD